MSARMSTWVVDGLFRGEIIGGADDLALELRQPFAVVVEEAGPGPCRES